MSAPHAQPRLTLPQARALEQVATDALRGGEPLPCREAVLRAAVAALRASLEAKA